MVEWKRIKDIGQFFGGLTGKTKDDFIDGNAKFVTYMNVFTQPSFDASITGTVKIQKGEKQNIIQRGDILFTGSSETPEEAGMSCVVTDELREDYYLNSFCFGLRLDCPDCFNLHFLKHLLRSYYVRREIAKSAKGVTRFNISKERFGKIQLPIPSLSEQQRIATILDTFTASIENLKQRIAIRRKQYEYYRDQLLDMEGKDEKDIIRMGDFCEIVKGNGVQKVDFVDKGYGCIHYGQIYTSYGSYVYMTNKFVSKNTFDEAKKASKGDIIMTDTSETVDDICKSVAYLGEEDIAVSNHTFIIKHKQDPKFLSFSTQTYSFLKQKRMCVASGKVSSIKARQLASIKIYLPSIIEQHRIVALLDTFEASIQILETRLLIRKKQYDYYREKLLTFK